MWSGLARALQPESIQNGLQTATDFLRTHWARVSRIGVVGGLWIAGLMWIQHNIHEFAATYVILSGLVALAVHLFSGDDKDKPQDGLSAYSVFNKGGQRMMGSLSAEQFENEIRHRQPGARDEDNHIDAREQQEPQDASDEDDPDLMVALQLSLQEKKREERRARRTRRR
ncbi:hypothetical protein Poli38472_006773 [Pythium oligandrum]|uniref:SAYSvFN domain-containing protein n=1 Tax=Pythium oligandrum TaxID=41045 RepID=A0A8K1C5F7_PYTOL|nr:hypothetical protein Poli38472_006773 [Pythium oligandrum]|eukprot:TMW56763.1 hypothetical protein Poli38472_006773 [Pythium oligandrum]